MNDTDLLSILAAAAAGMSPADEYGPAREIAADLTADRARLTSRLEWLEHVCLATFTRRRLENNETEALIDRLMDGEGELRERLAEVVEERDLLRRVVYLFWRATNDQPIDEILWLPPWARELAGESVEWTKQQVQVLAVAASEASGEATDG